MGAKVYKWKTGFAVTRFGGGAVLSPHKQNKKQKTNKQKTTTNHSQDLHDVIVLHYGKIFCGQGQTSLDA